MKMNLQKYMKASVTLPFVFVVVLNFAVTKCAFLHYDYFIDATAARTICESNNGKLPAMQTNNNELLNGTYWIDGCNNHRCAVNYKYTCKEKNCSEMHKFYCEVDLCISNTRIRQNVSVISEKDANTCAQTCCRNDRCIGINIENNTCLMYEEGTREEAIYITDKAIKVMTYKLIKGSDTPSICPTSSSSTQIVSTSDYQSTSSTSVSSSIFTSDSSSSRYTTSSSRYTSDIESSSIFTSSSIGSSIGSSSSFTSSSIDSSSIGSSSLGSSSSGSSSGSSLISSQDSNQHSATSQFISSTSNIESSDLISASTLSSSSQASISPTSTYVAVTSTASFSSSIDDSSNMVSASTTVQTTNPSQDLSSSLEPSFSSKCLCHCRGPTKSLTEEESKSKMSKLRAELTIPKKDLSSTIRKKTSASDNRVSATGIGMVGVVMMCVVFGGIIILDLGMLVSHLGILYHNLFGHCRS